MVKEEVIKKYLSLQTCSDRRIKKIEHILKSIEKEIGKPLDKLKVEDVAKYLRILNQSDLKNWTKNDYKKIFKRFLKWKYKKFDMIEGELVRESFKGISRKRAFNHDKINKNTLLKPEELEKLVRAAKTLKWKALITFAYESAFRPCEIVALKWKDLNFDDSMNICRVNIVSPKTKDKREIPVRDCIVHLKRWRAEYSFAGRTENDYVFPSQTKKDKPMTSATIGQMFSRMSQLAGIRNVFPYLIRHSRIYEVQKKNNEKIAAKFAGHSVETSEIYNHIADDDVEKSLLETMYVTEELTEDEKLEFQQLKKEWKYYKPLLIEFEQDKLKYKSFVKQTLDKSKTEFLKQIPN